MFCVVLILFVYPFIGAGARGWVVDTAGHGVGLSANCRAVLGTWPPLVMNVVNILIYYMIRNNINALELPCFLPD